MKKGKLQLYRDQHNTGGIQRKRGSWQCRTGYRHWSAVTPCLFSGFCRRRNNEIPNMILQTLHNHLPSSDLHALQSPQFHPRQQELLRIVLTYPGPVLLSNKRGTIINKCDRSQRKNKLVVARQGMSLNYKMLTRIEVIQPRFPKKKRQHII